MSRLRHGQESLIWGRVAVARFCQLAEDLPELVAAEINPLLATEDDIVALDALMISNGKIDGA